MKLTVNLTGDAETAFAVTVDRARSTTVISNGAIGIGSLSEKQGEIRCARE